MFVVPPFPLPSGQFRIHSTKYVLLAPVGPKIVFATPILKSAVHLPSCLAALLVASEGPRSVGNESATIAKPHPPTQSSASMLRVMVDGTP